MTQEDNLSPFRIEILLRDTWKKLLEEIYIPKIGLADGLIKALYESVKSITN